MNIKDGFYKVSFHAALPGMGGIVVVRENQVQGADEKYLYSGVLNIREDNVTSSITVAAYTSGATSVFGTSGGKFELQLTGQVSGSGFQLSGASPIAGQPPIQIHGTFIAPITL